jgi:hypothetical protein
MSFIVRIAKNIWPRLFVNSRAPVDRASYRTLPDGTPRTLPSGEVRTLPL